MPPPPSLRDQGAGRPESLRGRLEAADRREITYFPAASRRPVTLLSIQAAERADFEFQAKSRLEAAFEVGICLFPPAGRAGSEVEAA